MVRTLEETREDNALREQIINEVIHNAGQIGQKYNKIVIVNFRYARKTDFTLTLRFEEKVK